MLIRMGEGRRKGFADAADEEGQQTPSTEKRPLFCIAVDEPWVVDEPLQFHYRHAENAHLARVQFILFQENKGHPFHTYTIIEVARVVGYFVNDSHGDALSVS